jgi:DNA-directed RNA polymerase subunit RPC12/RpoP
LTATGRRRDEHFGAVASFPSTGELAALAAHVRYLPVMAREGAATTTIACPHCGKSFGPQLLASGPERHRGYKCPHCKLFVPESRADYAPLGRQADS